MSFRLFLVFIIIGGVLAGPKLKQQPGKEGDIYRVGTKRSILDFGLMIWCGTGRNPLDYNTYGCYCGFGGRGTPMDDVDRCCQVHDMCYNDVQRSNVCSFNIGTYLIPYSTHSCTGCKPASYYWFYGRCRNALCECDSAAVKCFMRSRYQDKYAGYSNNRC